MEKYIALYGGSFDPPHNGHVLTISHLLNDERIAEVWLVPSGDARYDKSSFATGEERLELLKVVQREVFQGNERIHILESQLKGALEESTAISLVRSLRADGEKRPLLYVIGADNLPTLNMWRDFDALITEVEFLFIPRLGEEVPKEMPEYVKQLDREDIASCSFSSSELRALLKDGAEVVGYLPNEVLRVIEERGMYERHRS
ncbi:nicotinate-nicotinamide nucleotide adenylyltransferase [bacterium]|jgi:nicotinate-nucleotide adenylyltransferase|nr:nicotinate-nicotinamide nucleotide adenylyltransferase [bacterium]